MSDREGRVYVGDSVYVHKDEFGALVLETSNGREVSNQIYLELEVLDRLLYWIEEQYSVTVRKKGTE